MSVRVIMEREVDPGQEAALQRMLMELRGKAMLAKGYISGETLRDLNNPHKFLVISNWNSIEDWRAWENNPDRKKLQDELTKFLRGPETRSIYGHIF